jgi:hypothetical protein
LLNFGSLLGQARKADSAEMLRRIEDDTAGTVIPSRVTAAASAGIATKDAWGLRRSNTLEHTAGFCSREKLSRMAVTRWLMASRVITAARLFFAVLPERAGIEPNPARPRGRAELPDDRRVLGLQV